MVDFFRFVSEDLLPQALLPKTANFLLSPFDSFGFLTEIAGL